MTTEIWQDDVLGRSGDARLLIDFLKERVAERLSVQAGGSYVVNLNAEWGQGKTYFLDNLHLQLQAEGFLSAFVNGWRDDAGQEPLVAVMAAMETALRPHFVTADKAKSLWQAAKANGGQALGALASGVTKQLARKYIGEGLDELIDIFGGPDGPSEVGVKPTQASGSANAKLSNNVAEDVAKALSSISDRYITDQINNYKKRISSTGAFKEKVSKLLKYISERDGVNLPFFILIDELDRCRPTYALEMLEQVKHLFDIDYIVFIIATDSDQLSHSIRNVYGEGFDGTRYLNKFFNRQYKFEHPNIHPYVKLLFSSSGIDDKKLEAPFMADAIAFTADAANYYKLSLRDIAQCFDILHSVTTTWKEPVPIQLVYMLPIIVLFHKGNGTELDAFLANGPFKIGDSSRDHLWTYKYLEADGYTGRQTPKDGRAVRMLDSIRTNLHQPLADLARKEESDPSSRWLCQFARTELEVLHRGISRGQEGPFSLLQSYGRRVKGMGRFSVPTS